MTDPVSSRTEWFLRQPAWVLEAYRNDSIIHQVVDAGIEGDFSDIEIWRGIARFQWRSRQQLLEQVVDLQSGKPLPVVKDGRN